jgi:hypothetical protein
MPTILHISSAGTAWWKTGPSGWELTDEPQSGYVGVVADLAEETFLEITVPRILGTDRSHYIQRQLLNRFPETVFRVALPSHRAGGFVDRLAPLTQTLSAVDPGEKIQHALDASKVPIAGVWSASLLLAQLGKKKSLPENLFIVLCQPTGMRILFLKQRSPVLTRLITANQTAAEQAAEIERTLRHLENTRVIERENPRFGILLLGGAAGLREALSSDRLDVVPLPAPWAGQAVHDWNHVLFDLACKGPPGQLAPLNFRASYLARQWKFATRVGMALSVVVAAVTASASIFTTLGVQQERSQVVQRINQVNAELEKTQRAIEAFGVAPQMLQKVLNTDTSEIISVPSFDKDLQQIATVIASVDGARIKSMQWQTLGPSQPSCSKEGAAASLATPAPDAMSSAAEPSPQRRAEVQMAILLSDGLGPRMQLRQASEITSRLRQLQGSEVIQDPALRLKFGDIVTRGPSAGQTDGAMDWCLTLSLNPKEKQPSGASP